MARISGLSYAVLAVLTLAASGLAYLNWQIVFRPPDQILGRAGGKDLSWTPPDLAIAGGVFVMPPAAQYSEIKRRPVFSQTRRPYVMPPPKPAVRQAIRPEPVRHDFPEDVVLLGILRTGDLQAALLSRIGTDTARWIGKGDEFLHWRVQSLGEDFVIMSHKKNRNHVYLYEKLQNTRK